MNKKTRKRVLICIIITAVLSFAFAVIFKLPFLVPIPFIMIGISWIINYYNIRENSDKRLWKYDFLNSLFLGLAFSLMGFIHMISMFYSDYNSKNSIIYILYTLIIVFFISGITTLILKNKAEKRLT